MNILNNMSEPRLKSILQIQAAVLASSKKGIPTTVVKRGDPDAGIILVKVFGGTIGCVVFYQSYDFQEDRLYWSKLTGDKPVEEAEADKLIAREVSFDQDIWVLEVEDKLLRNPLAPD